MPIVIQPEKGIGCWIVGADSFFWYAPKPKHYKPSVFARRLSLAWSSKRWKHHDAYAKCFAIMEAESNAQIAKRAFDDGDFRQALKFLGKAYTLALDAYIAATREKK